MKRLFFLIVAVLVIGCTTSMYGKGFVPDPSNPDQYTFKIYTGGFAGGETADNRAEKEIKEFMSNEGYSSHEVVNRRSNLFPTSYFEYTVRFER